MTVLKELTKRGRRRRFRVRNHVRRAAHGRLRLSVFRSNRHMSAQIIDDSTGKTVVSASTLEKALYGSGTYAGNREAAAKVGNLLAERAMEKGVQAVVFDRGKYKYHGRVAALAEAAREGGLRF